ncbi:MAG TPA: S8 family peptidase [Cytophagales bacterium]|nr:S8 family peptidase [Cytophagales bacterium]
MRFKLFFIPLFFLLSINTSFSFTDPDPESEEKKFLNWFNRDPKKDKVYGISTEKAYDKILKGKSSKPVIVAIIDSGVDIEHEDIKDKIWINEKEIAGNGIDDDKNGYVDDIHGWNFLGNSKGENIKEETLELTRLYKKYDSLFKDLTEEEIKPEETELYNKYLKIKQEFEQETQEAEQELQAITNFERNFKVVDDIIKELLQKETYTLEDVTAIKPETKEMEQVKNYVMSLMEKGFSHETLTKYKEHYENKLMYHLNPEFNPRTLIGDNPENVLDSLYGNNDVKGAASDHGTHVAGIIGAVRDNNLGIKGVADNVQLMVLRAVPDGDERDKDIANAIKYAVNNGAQIINMSFGKSYSPQKQAVDEALKKAEARGVLLVHAAGNDAVNIDTAQNFPNKEYLATGNEAKNWLTIGASSNKADEELVGSFSNFGRESVDVFAPGVDVYSLKPENEYGTNSGTSMACPVVSGVAALIMSYYPTLTAPQVKEIILLSSVKPKKLKVNIPSEGQEEEKQKTTLDAISVTGGVVNAYEAVKLAEKYARGKQKIVKY